MLLVHDDDRIALEGRDRSSKQGSISREIRLRLYLTTTGGSTLRENAEKERERGQLPGATECSSLRRNKTAAAFSDHRIILVCVYAAVFFRDQPLREMRYGRSDRIIASQLTSVGVGIRLILSQAGRTEIFLLAREKLGRGSLFTIRVHIHTPLTCV